MLLSMIVSLYTSRVVLNALGIDDFGIYNVVGGIVIMLGFLNNAMAASTQRFLTFEIGKNDVIQLKKIFNMSVTIHIIIALIVLLISETLGVWFLNNKMNIPVSRLIAANWVYQFSVFSFIITVLSVPYNAAIIAHERMKAFALVGLIEVFLKLIIAVIIVFYSFDKLILYSFLLFLISLIIRIIYGVYCNRQFEESKNYNFNWDQDLFKSMGNFAGWNLLGVSAAIGYNQGVNILLNIFFGPTVNAARGIAFQVQGAVNSFVANFQVAVNPTITKLYAQGETEKSYKLVFSSSKFSFFLLLLLSMPLLIETNTVLSWWLKVVPEYAVIFTRLVLIDILIGSISGSIQSLVQATGKIKNYQLFVSGVLLLNLPISYLFLKFGYAPEYTLMISVFFSFCALFVRLIIIKKLFDFPINDFIYSVLGRIMVVSMVSSACVMFTNIYIPDSNWKFLLLGITSFIIISVLIYIIGLNAYEKSILKTNYRNIINKLTL